MILSTFLLSIAVARSCSSSWRFLSAETSNNKQIALKFRVKFKSTNIPTSTNEERVANFATRTKETWLLVKSSTYQVKTISNRFEN